MAGPTVTYSFSNSSVADADQVNTNFTDLINGATDGTKDYSINALTVAGAATLNGTVTLGNATSDDLTFTGYQASNIIPKTTNAYSFGSSSLGYQYVYLAAGGTYTARLAAGTASASWNLTFPTSAGRKGQGLYDTNGSGTLGWAPTQTDIYTATDANYTVTDTDGYGTILVDPGASDRTITLPTAADNTDRVLTITKITADAGFVIIDGEGSETINGRTNFYLVTAFESLTVRCNGTSWDVVGGVESGWYFAREQQTSGTDGGTATSGSWATRTLNTEAGNTALGALVSNQITLQPGVYEIHASAPAYKVNGHQAKLYNVTGTADVILGTGERAETVGVTSRSVVAGRFSITTASAFELRHQVQTTRATDGWGLQIGFTTTEVYSEVRIRKLVV